MIVLLHCCFEPPALPVHRLLVYMVVPQVCTVVYMHGCTSGVHCDVHGCASGVHCDVHGCTSGVHCDTVMYNQNSVITEQDQEDHSLCGILPAAT